MKSTENILKTIRNQHKNLDAQINKISILEDGKENEWDDDWYQEYE